MTITGSKPWERMTKRRVSRSAFERGGKFIFESREVAVGPESEWARMVVWSDGTTVRSWWTVRPTVGEVPTIHDALGALAGVSGGTSSFAAALLLPRTDGRLPIPMAESARRLGECEVNGRRCVRIEGVSSFGQPLVLSMDTESFLVSYPRVMYRMLQAQARRLRNANLWRG